MYKELHRCSHGNNIKPHLLHQVHHPPQAQVPLQIPPLAKQTASLILQLQVEGQGVLGGLTYLLTQVMVVEVAEGFYQEHCHKIFKQVLFLQLL
jgi:hypothetical protein